MLLVVRVAFVLSQKVTTALFITKDIFVPGTGTKVPIYLIKDMVYWFDIFNLIRSAVVA